MTRARGRASAPSCVRAGRPVFLRDVAAVAGYVNGRSGQRYSLVALINHDNANAARPALDQLVEWVALDR